MKSVAIYFSSVDGHTFKICQYIQHKLEDAGIQVFIYDIAEQQQIHLANIDFVLIAASIRYGNYRKSLYQIIENNLEILKQTKSGFFSVSATARKEGRDIVETDHYFKKLKEKTGWTPDIACIFAGAIHYPQYHVFDRLMIQLIMWMTQGPTDTSKYFEFTDWDKVKAFSTDIIDQILLDSR